MTGEVSGAAASTRDNGHSTGVRSAQERKSLKRGTYNSSSCSVLSIQKALKLKRTLSPYVFSMPSELLISQGDAKSYYFTESCVPESMFNYFK